MAFGIDYSYGGGLTTGQMRSAGVTFVCRYLSYQPNSKNVTRTEFGNLVKAGLQVVLVWEQSGRDASGGSGAGAAHAREADKQASALGAAGAVIYFAPCDYDAPPGDQGLINAYLDGAASVIGHARTGFYGGYYPLKRAFDANKMRWGWQTYAWSGGNLDSRAHLYQYRNGAAMGPAEVDFDRSLQPDFGGWPRKVSASHPAASPHPAQPVQETDMPATLAYLPDASVVTVPLGKEITRLRFATHVTETVKIDQLGVKDPSANLDLGYDVANAGHGGIGINPDCLVVRVVRDTKGELAGWREAENASRAEHGMPAVQFPPLGVWLISS